MILPAKKLIKSFKLLIVVILVSSTLNSCGTYRDTLSQTEYSLKSNNYASSLQSIDNNKFLGKKRNRLLYLLEKGKLEHLNKNYRESNNYFEQAYFLIEDRSKHIGAKIGAAFTNPEAEPYKAEDFEKTTLHYYKALNFFQLGEYDNALVEAKRINIKLNRLNDKYKKRKNKYTQDAFSQILQGLIYEAKNDINNAFIAYRNAADVFVNNNNNYFGVTIPNQLQKDVIRTAHQLGFTDEVRKYQKLFNLNEIPKSNQQKEVVFFWENGLGPYKDQTKITLSNIGGSTSLGSYSNEEYGIVVPIPIGGNTGISSIAIPKYKERMPYYNKAVLSTSNNQAALEPAQNYFNIAKQCLKDRIGREIGKTILRFATKKAASKGAEKLAGLLGAGFLGKKLTKLGADALGAALEKADTRNWQTIPNTIYYTRIAVDENENSVKLKLYSDYDSNTKDFNLNPSKKIEIINYTTFDKVNNTQQDYEDNVVASNNTNTYSQNTANSALMSKMAVINNANNFNSQKKSLIGIGARYSIIENEIFSYATLEPEFTYYNNNSKIGFSLAYGFIIKDPESIDTYPTMYFDSYSKLAGNFLLGLTDGFGLVFEGQSISGDLYVSSDSSFTAIYDTYGGGLGVFFKGGTNTMGKLILGYNAASETDVDNSQLSGLYLTGGFNITF